MAERRPLRCKLQFQYRFDRLLPDKLEQAYQLSVPDHARPIGCPVTTLPQENLHDASRGHLTRVSSDRQKEEHTIASQTAALLEYAQKHSYVVPPEWVFQDEGHSGATLVRPGLEALRDLAAQGQMVAVLVYSPDRLSRKYAYQVLLAEEFSRCGVQLVFLQSPAGTTAEDQLVVQLQGMIAEYERAQIAERSRRGKRHKAQQGVVNVLSGSPYGYHYVKKSDASAGYYQVVEAEAQVVRWVFEMYTQQQLSLNAMARQLNQRQILTRSGKVG